MKKFNSGDAAVLVSILLKIDALEPNLRLFTRFFTLFHHFPLKKRNFWGYPTLPYPSEGLPDADPPVDDFAYPGRRTLLPSPSALRGLAMYACTPKILLFVRYSARRAA